MKLEELIKDIEVLNVVNFKMIDIQHITFDSRDVKQGSLFVALKGTQVDGHRFIPQAIEKGAIVIICEDIPKLEGFSSTLHFIKVSDSSTALSKVASNFYHHPSKSIQLIGVTGTNGKTTTVTLLYNLFKQLGYKVGLLSTVENKIVDRIIPATHTTPDALSISALLREMVDEGCEYAFMEVSSHAIHQNRVKGLSFRGGIFTNLSHDHLDYHQTFKAYIAAKKKFFDDLPKSAFALTNLDDKQGKVMVQNTKAIVATYSLRKIANYKARILENRIEGLYVSINEQAIFCRLIGVFNAYNLLAVYAVGVLLGEDPEELLLLLSDLKAAEGRFDTVIEDGKIGIVDYAHTPDALENVLDTIQKTSRKTQKILTVVGCGGDRDSKKRPIMAKVACEKSDLVILTSDNPRSEDPYDILGQMESGIPSTEQDRVLTIENREQAIKVVCKLAKKGDIILIAGKGHEKYQEIKGEKFPFDDKQTLINRLREGSSNA